MSFGKATCATRIGERSYQEDRLVLVERESSVLIGVMDGHGGDHVSDYCRVRIPGLIPANVTNPEEMLKKMVATLDLETRLMRSGSTLSLVHISEVNNQAVGITLGDSRIVVETTDGNTVIGPEHNARSNENERRAAEARGGVYAQGYIRVGLRGLQMGRALGNAMMGAVISKEPELTIVDNPDIVLVATDGVFDPGHEDEDEGIIHMAQLLPTFATAEELMKQAERNYLIDNATAVLWRRNP